MCTEEWDRIAELKAENERLRAELAQALGRVVPAGPDATPVPKDDGDFWIDDRPIVGHCSKCGEAREGFYTCRDGGETLPPAVDEIQDGGDS